MAENGGIEMPFAIIHMPGGRAFFVVHDTENYPYPYFARWIIGLGPFWIISTFA